MDNLYENPRTVFQDKINDILKKDMVGSEVFSTIFKLQQVSLVERPGSRREDPDQWRIMLELYTKLGSTLFTSIISVIDGKTLTYPTAEEFEDQILTTLCYYYREVEGLDWRQVKSRLSLPKLNTVQYGIKIRQLKSFIDTQLFERLAKVKPKRKKEEKVNA